jgi:hypothetical protein
MAPTAVAWGPRRVVVATHTAVHVALLSADSVAATFRLAAFGAPLPT